MEIKTVVTITEEELRNLVYRHIIQPYLGINTSITNIRYYNEDVGNKILEVECEKTPN